MFFSIYLIGASISICWFVFLAFVVFENWVYDLQNEEGKDSIENFRKFLTEMNPENPQKTFVFFSIFITLFWPVMIPYIFYKSRFD